MLRLACVLFFFAAFSRASPFAPEDLHTLTYEQFTRTFSKEASPERRALFHAELSRVRAHNQAGLTWLETINKFSDWTVEEKRALLGVKSDLLAQQLEELRSQDAFWKSASPQRAASLASVDWRNTAPSVLNGIKDQGRCGSCWTFGGCSSAIASAYAIKHGNLPLLSEQAILDCTPNPEQCGGTGGCGGGTAKLCVDSLMQHGGIPSEWTYPYESYFGRNFPTCRLSPNTPAVVKLTGIDMITPNNEADLVAKLQEGPVSIAVDAGSWFPYHSGVYNGCNQTHPVIDHAVLLVGATPDTWVIANSWAPSWGDAGYITLKRNANNATCGMDLSPGAGLGCKGGPSEVKVCGTCGVVYSGSVPRVA